MIKLRDPKARAAGFNRAKLRAVAMVMVAVGIVGRSVFQNRLLGVGAFTPDEMLAILQQRPEAMALATVALLFCAIEACATPLFALLLVEGFEHTSDLKKYVIRVAGVAVISELPYNLAMSGKLFDVSSRNPVFAMVLALGLLYLYKTYGEKSFKNTLLKAFATVAVMLWPMILRITDGECVLLLVAVLWAFRKKPLYRNLIGTCVAVVCSVVSPFYLAAPMSFLVVYFYNGEQGTENRMVNYLAYPALLLIVGVLAKYLI